MMGKTPFYNYEEFVSKFKRGCDVCTDDCFTPEPVFEAVADYVAERYGIQREEMVRPFFPGGDYRAYGYDKKVVVDNPPFSIFSEIVRFYLDEGVRFFLFAPGLTVIASEAHAMRCNHIVTDATITYENGARVNTGFVTNLDDGIVLEADPDLAERILAVQGHGRKRPLPYPRNVVSVAKMTKLANIGIPFSIGRDECVEYIKKIGDRKIYGGGLVVTEDCASRLDAALALRQRMIDGEEQPQAR